MSTVVMRSGFLGPLSRIGVRYASSRSKKYAFASRKGKSLSPNVGVNSLKSSQKNNMVKSANSVTAKTLNAGAFSQLSEVDRKSRTMHKNLLENIDSFESLRINPEVRSAIVDGLLGHLETKKPTAIQTLSTKMIRSTKSNDKLLKTWLMAAETGSGKTVAYLAPLLSDLKDLESKPEWGHLKDLPIIRSVILVPSMELVNQVSSVIKQICSSCKLSFFACTSTTSGATISRKLNERLDVLICTPEKLNRIFEKHSAKVHLSNCQSVVVDEADSLMDDSFGPSTLKAIGLAANIQNLVFCSATIPRKFDKLMRSVYPDAQRIVAPGIHKMPSHVDFRVIEVFRPPYMDNKELALQQALYAIYHDNTEVGLVKRVVVFVNKKEHVDPLVAMLQSKNYVASGITGKLNSSERSKLIQDFVETAKPLSEGAAKLTVLVTTDLLARGIDMRNIRNVILYDMPNTSVDLLHRAGRTGRLGKRGRVLLFVNKRDSRSWVKGLQKAVNQGLSLA